MSMNKEALDKLLELGSQEAGIRNVGASKHPFITLHGAAKTISLESFLDAPLRKKAVIEVRDSDSFIEYINKHKESGSVLFFNRDRSDMMCALEYHDDTPRWWKDHTITFDCPHSMEWERWSGSDGSKMNQTEFAEFMEDNCKDVVRPPSADMLALAKTFEAKEKVTFSSGVRTDNGDIALEYVNTTAAAAGSSGSIQIPKQFYIGVRPYEGGKAYEVECRFKYRIKDGLLIMWFEIVNKDLLLREAFDAELEKVRDGIGKEVMQLNGQPGRSDRL